MKTIYLLLFLSGATLLSANQYQKNVQVFTVNTAQKRCSTPLHVVYQGNKEGYGVEVAKYKEEIASAVRGGTQTALTNLQGSVSADAITGGAIVGAGVIVLNSVVNGITGDNEYLYVTECNRGKEKTRLMTLVVSNDKMSPSAWIALAKQDQAKAKR